MVKKNNLQKQNTYIFFERIQKFITIDRILILSIVFGVIFRIATYWTDIPRFDGALYATLGYNFLKNCDFLTLNGTKAYGYSLIYPIYLAVFYSLFGFTISVTKIASIFMSIAVLGVVYLTTKDLLNYQKAIVATAIIALMPTMIDVTGKNYIENCVLLFFVPTVWAMIKGFKDSRYIVVASVFAGLTYYTKTDVGFMIVIAGMLAFAVWRFYYIRWSLFKDKNYYLAFIIIFLMVLLRATLVWSTNVTSGITVPYSSNLVATDGFLRFLSQIPYHALLLYSFFIFFIPELKNSIKKIGGEYYNLLFLIIIGLTCVVILHASGYPMFSTSPLKRVSREYITIIYVPVLWLLLKNADLTGLNSIESLKCMVWKLILDKKRMGLILLGLIVAVGTAFIDDWLALLLLFGAFSFAIRNIRKRIVLMLLVFLLLSTNSITGSYQPGYIDASEEISKSVSDGDVIAILKFRGDPIPDRTYLYITNHNVSVVYYKEGATPTYIMSQRDITFEGYTFIDVYYGDIHPSILKKIVSKCFETDTIGVIKKSTGEEPIYLWKRTST